MPGVSGVFAHEGGWDEALLVLVPLFVLGGLVLAATYRSARRTGDDDAPDQPGSPTDPRAQP